MGRDQDLKWLAFSLYHLSFFLYSPFKANSINGLAPKYKRRCKDTKKLILCHTFKFLIPITLKPDGINLRYFKHRLFDLTE